MQNPYHPLSPPDDPTLFFGRQDSIALLRQHLVGAHNTTAIVILGRRGMGKTALLHQTAYLVDERYITVYLDLAEQHEWRESTQLRYFAQTILARMETIGADTYRIPPFPDSEDPAVWRTWFAEEFLDVATTAIRRDRFLLLLVDDMQLWFEPLGDSWLAYWHDLLKRYERLDMVAAIDLVDEPHILNYPLLANLHQHNRLQSLDEEAARQLILEPVAEHFHYTEDALARLALWCGGNPFLLHSVCRLVYRHYEGNRQLTHISAEFLEVLQEAVLEEAGEIMESVWENSTLAMQSVLRALLHDQTRAKTLEQLLTLLQEHDGNVNPTSLVSTLRKLEYFNLVKSSPSGEYSFQAELEAIWFAQRQQEAAEQSPKSLRPNPLVGLAVMIVGVVLVGILLASITLNDSSEEIAPDEEALPTSTLSLNLSGSQAAREFTQTAEAIPSPTITPSPTP